MTSVTTRAGKGSPLLNSEIDANFENLNNNKLEISEKAVAADLTAGTNNSKYIPPDVLVSFLRSFGLGVSGSNNSYITSPFDMDNLVTGGVYSITYAGGITNAPIAGDMEVFVLPYDANNVVQLVLNFVGADRFIMMRAMVAGVWSGWDRVAARFATSAEAQAGNSSVVTMSPVRTRDQVRKAGILTNNLSSDNYAADLGALANTGFYAFDASTAGIPAGATLGVVFNGEYDNTNDVQFLFDIPTAKQLTRFRSAGTWGSWAPALEITGAASTIVDTDLSAGKVVISDGSGKIAASTVTSAELDYLSGVTSAIQGQLDSTFKNTGSPTFSGGVASFKNADGATISATGTQYGLEVRQATLAADAFMTFHIVDQHASYFGLRGSDNALVWGGWSSGASVWKVYHEGNKPTAAEIGAAALTGAAFTGGISATGTITAGLGSGGVTMNVNDGGGNANIAFNHNNKIPEQAGNCGRISVNTDSTTNAAMLIGVKSNSGTSTVEVVNGIKLTDTATELYYAGSIKLATETGGVGVTGTLTASANLSAYSDETLKDNWVSLSYNFVEELSEVKVGTYNRIDLEDGFRHVGISAQSLRNVMPEAVREDENGILHVTHGSAALAACVELAKEVVSLRKRLEALEG